MEALSEDEIVELLERACLDLALQAPSEGVLIYKWEDLVDDPERMEIVKSMIGR